MREDAALVMARFDLFGLLGILLSAGPLPTLGSARSCDEPWDSWAAQNDQCRKEIEEMSAEHAKTRDELDVEITENGRALETLKEEWRKTHEEFKKGNEYLRPAMLLSSVRKRFLAENPEEPPKCQCVLADKCGCLPKCQQLTQQCLALKKQVTQWVTLGKDRRNKMIASQKHRMEAIPELQKRLKESDPKNGRYAVPTRGR